MRYLLRLYSRKKPAILGASDVSVVEMAAVLMTSMKSGYVPMNFNATQSRVGSARFRIRIVILPKVSVRTSQKRFYSSNARLSHLYPPRVRFYGA